MTIQDYVRQLARGVLRNTAMADLAYNFTKESNFVTLATFIDEGLLRLYSRFIIKERHLFLEMRPGITFYHLTKLYSVQGGDTSRVPYPYIMDLPNDPFLEDVIKVLNIVDSDGVTRPLNDHSKSNSLFTPQFNIIQNLYPRDLECLSVAYQAKPTSVLVPKFESWDSDAEVFLPDALIPALTAYVAYLYYSPIGSQESSSIATANLMMYEQVCRDVERMDLVNNSMSCTNTRFGQNGWR